MKICTKCGETKPLDAFYRAPRNRSGRFSACIACTNRANLAWNKAHPKNIVASNTKWRELNRAACSRIGSRWAKRFPDRVNANVTRREAAKLKATPTWVNKGIIDAMYTMAVAMTKLTGIKYHVDHIVPLRSKLVSGLHVERNLQIIPAAQNCRKSNRYWFDMPETQSLQ